jgi:hypothetical protein
MSITCSPKHLEKKSISLLFELSSPEVVHRYLMEVPFRKNKTFKGIEPAPKQQKTIETSPPTTSPQTIPLQVLSINPMQGGYNDVVIITGSGFDESTIVMFGDVAMRADGVNAGGTSIPIPEVIVFKCPNLASTGDIYITVVDSRGVVSLPFLFFYESAFSYGL